MENGMTLSDIAAVTNKNSDDWGGGGAWWIIVLFIFMFGNGFWNRNGSTSGEAVTEAGLCNAMNFNNLENAVGRLSDLTQNQTYQIGDAVNSLSKENALGQASIIKQISDGDYALAQQMANCCCTTQQNIAENKYTAEKNTAAINENTTTQIQKVLDAITTNRMAEMQNQINELQLQSAMCGVVRYPSVTAYSAGANPYFSAGCGTTF
jgi:hypothetical protein